MTEEGSMNPSSPVVGGWPDEAAARRASKAFWQAFHAGRDPAFQGRAALLAAIPEGWALVPKEPTEEMERHAYDTLVAPYTTGREDADFRSGWTKAYADAYRAMLAAAPAPDSSK
jgi:hypothetical protein